MTTLVAMVKIIFKKKVTRFSIYNFFCATGDTTACKQYKSYFFGNDLAVGNDLIIMVFSSFLYLVLLLLLESIFLQRFWEKMNTMYYRLRMRKNYYSFDEQIDSNPENGLFTKPGLCYIFFSFFNVGVKIKDSEKTNLFLDGASVTGGLKDFIYKVTTTFQKLNFF